MHNYRRSTSCWLISQALCFFLLLQGSGIAQALPLPPKQTFVSSADLEAPLVSPLDPDAREPDGALDRFLSAARSSAADAGSTLRQWLAAPWPGSSPATTGAAPFRVAQAGGVLPLPSRLMSVVMAASGRGRAAPPSPPDLGEASIEDTPPAALAKLLEKAATEQIPLLAGLNLISIPEEPATPDPATVFAAVAAELGKVTAYDACDLADPWKVYDPADLAATDLTAVDHKIGMWVLADAATVLPSDGTLPATTTIELCEGWNLIGFPTGEPRHPYAALSSIAGKWERIFGYDAFDSQDPWEYFDPAVPDWANDLTLMHPGRGYWVLASESATLEIRNSGPPPTVAIISPADLAVVTEPTEIFGTVESDRLDSWTLTSRPIGDGDPVTLATGNAPVAGGALATLDPTLLLNGLYELELTATDVQGQQVSESIAVAVEGQMKIGHFTLSFVDLAVPVSGLDIEIIRTYDSRDKQPRDFGVGWSLGLRQGSYRNNRAPGDGWQLQTGFVACDTALESKSHLTVVRLSDREVYRFALRLVRGVPRNGGGCSATAEFVYVDGPLPGTTLAILGNDQVFQEAQSSNQVLDLDTFATYEPRQVRLTTRDGRIFELDLSDGVTLVEDLNGNQLSITPAGITHSTGKGIAFDRDAGGRIIRITDPLDRVLSYDYDVAGDLVRFTDRVGAVNLFAFDGDHRLLDVEDRRGIKSIRIEYDPEGRVVRHIDALNKVIELSHDLGNRRETITDRLGHTRTLEYDGRGNVIRETDQLGKATSRVFDGRDRLLSQTDPLNHTTTFVYTTGGDLESLADPLGNVTRFSYNSRGQQLTITDPGGGVTASIYDSRGNLTQSADPLGRVTDFTYDASGNLLTTTDALSQVTRFEYDNFGNRVRDTDALGYQVDSTYDGVGNRQARTRTRTLVDGSTETLLTTFVYDGLDRMTSTTAADGSITNTAYDLLGNAVSRTDPLGRVTTMTYDLIGRLTTTSYPDGTAESRSYDDEARLIARVDRGGRSTTFTYDPAGRLMSTTYPDGSSTSSTYDDVGQLVTTTEARGNTTRYSYDAGGQLTAIIDPLGNGPTFAYDENGNRTSVTDAKNHSTIVTYDPLGRQVATTYPDGTSTQVAYDEVGRRTSATDQAGIMIEFGYDALGRLTSVKDALERITSYTYDEIGNLLTQSDANGHTTRFEYDRLGRQTARVFADGSRESQAYNADGTLDSHTDFKGAIRTFQYDANQRLTRRAHPDDSEVTFTYTPTGKRASVTDARGTTTYAYDDRDRMTMKTDPAGYQLGYGYDHQGNRTSLTATVGTDVLSTAYGYDELNRLTSVTDSQGGLAMLAYDQNGDRVGLTYPNALTTSYSYDSLGRLTELRSESSNGEVVQSYQYTLGPAGNRIRADEHDGTSRRYQYDPLYRLTKDQEIDPAGTPVYQRDFTYDPVGNRLTLATDEGLGTDTVTSTYDVRDRLSLAAATTYTWDGNGSLTSQDERTYTWDFDNRLASVTTEDGTVIENVYDADGHRVRAVTTPPGGSPRTVDYLVDTTGFLSHVVAEIVAGSVQTLYTRADDSLFGLFRPASGVKRYLLMDGQGSVRALSDQAGSITDDYTYTAFGQLVRHSGADPNPYLFAGEAFDQDVGLYYNRARWLDVNAGRFVSVDSFQGLLSSPASKHSYAYARNSPVDLADPSGRFFSLAGALVAITAISSLAVIAQGVGAQSLARPGMLPVTLELLLVIDKDSGWQRKDLDHLLERASEILRPALITLEWENDAKEIHAGSDKHLFGEDEASDLAATQGSGRNIPVLLIGGFSNGRTLGKASRGAVPERCVRAPGIAMSEGIAAYQNSLAHEIGHIMCLAHRIADRQNLMFRTGKYGGSELNPFQRHALNFNANAFVLGGPSATTSAEGGLLPRWKSQGRFIDDRGF